MLSGAHAATHVLIFPDAFLADIERGQWPLEAPETMSKELSSILQLRTVLELHQQRCRICEDDIQALDTLLKQVNGVFQLLSCSAGQLHPYNCVIPL